MSLALPSRRLALSPRWTRDALWRRARVVPSLDLRFADSKSLVDAVSGQSLITFTRSSDGTYVGSDGLIKTATTNEPRFDHNPTTGECLGLLAEEQRTNLLLRSEEFGTWWTTQNASIATNVATSPSGAATADTLVEDTTATAVHQVYAPIAAGAGTYTFSVYAKSAGRATFRVAQESGGNSLFTLSGNGTAVALGSNTVSISSVGNGWYRCSSTYVATGAHNIYLALYNDSTIFYTGDGTSGIYIWGAQLEAGAFPTSYIPTTSSAATRNADVASITGTNFSSWYRQDEGTVFADARSNGSAGSERFSLIVQGSTFDDRWVVGVASTNQYQTFYALGGAAQANLTTGSLTDSSGFRIASVSRANDIAMVVNGGATLTDSSASLITANQLGIGRAAQYLNGTIRRLTYWPARLSNSTLQALTQ